MLALAFALLTVANPLAAEVPTAPPPRAKTCDNDKRSCLCPDGDLRCRARAALTLKAAAANQVAPKTVPTSAELDAVRRVLEKKAAEKKAEKK